MSDVDRLFNEYVEEHRGGGDADPRSFLARASPTERRELAALIDAYLVRGPRREFDPEGFRDSSSEQTVDELERVLRGRSGMWPSMLPRLRDRAGLRRSQLVERLAAALGVGEQATKVAGYYHQMEQGTLPADGVSDRVLGALGQILGEPLEALHDAGRAMAGPTEGVQPGQPAFARHAYPEAPSAAPAAAPPPSEQPEWDEVDQLFRGG